MSARVMASPNRALVLLLFAPLLPHCMPDFDALSAGAAGSSSGGTSSDAAGAGAVSGEPVGGEGGVASGGAAAGNAPTEVAGAGGESEAGAAGTEGRGGEPSCEPDPTTVMVHNGFDGGLESPDFSGTSAQADAHTTLKATASALWDSQEGHRCAGSLRLSCGFKSYASGDAPDEKAFVSYYFTPQDWSDAAALHAMVKVSPKAPPILGVRLFILSGESYLYTSTFDGTAFANGAWNEMILPLRAGMYYDPTNVHRLGVEVALLRADAPGIPATPPIVDVWVDDIYLEPN